MKIDEKLKHFTSVILEATEEECAKSYENYKNKMDDYYNEHVADAKKQKKINEKIEEDRIKRKFSKEYSLEQLQMRKKVNTKREELKKKVIEEVRNLLEEFYKTKEYTDLLQKQIIQSRIVARGEVINIYLDPKDENLLLELEARTKENLLVSSHSFGGGIRAEIPKKNIFIDKSFESKIEDMLESKDLWSDKKLIGYGE